MSLVMVSETLDELFIGLHFHQSQSNAAMHQTPKTCH